MSQQLIRIMCTNRISKCLCYINSKVRINQESIIIKQYQYCPYISKVLVYLGACKTVQILSYFLSKDSVVFMASYTPKTDDLAIKKITCVPLLTSFIILSTI